ncbi:DUF1707 domain-containing protein [Nocardia sp. SYP-A9097]|uniref:DUF1707 domain-containing protein n=1 Tax=Nocardia sp. SYP-A9097 TaxID=2663237 RepID=UPI00129AEF36|nr:DUF1707 domain-containing protein [Nocardia sp. SYP-A9097]MRH87658.1 DUF1707 domain-containing protein [Nocardia sp. SYP-A9097]
MDENRQPRIGTVERERAFEVLKQHLAADRINLTEFDERAVRIHAAATQSQIDSVFADLPALSKSPGRWKRFAAPAALGGALLVSVGAGATVVVDHSHSQATRTIVVTTVVGPTASLPATTTQATVTSSSTIHSTTTPTSAASGTPVPGVQYLMDLRKLDGATYLNFNSGPAEVSGTSYTRSIMLDPDGRHLAFVEYDLSRKYAHLDGALGVRDDATPTGMAMRFQIYADEVLVADSIVKLGDTAPIHVDFDRPLRLRLQVTNLNPGGDAYAIFGDLRATAN